MGSSLVQDKRRATSLRTKGGDQHEICFFNRRKYFQVLSTEEVNTRVTINVEQKKHQRMYICRKDDSVG